MGKKFVITTVVSGDYFRYFIPLFKAAASISYPEADIKVFVHRGEWPECYSMQFLEYPETVSMSNSLRYLISDNHVSGYDYWMSVDVDIMLGRPKKDHMAFYGEVMDDTNQPYASCRGPYKKPLQPQAAPDGWGGHFTRIASGVVMFRPQEFLRRTKAIRGMYRKSLMKQIPEQIDHVLPATYREYDEVMLYRIIHNSGMRTPSKKNCFVGGKRSDTTYRGIHLGDWKFAKRYKKERKMRSLIPDESVELWQKMQKNPVWLKAVEESSVEPKVGRLLEKARKYLDERHSDAPVD